MIRPATWADVDAVADLGVEALERDPIGSIDRDSIVKTVSDGVSSAQHFMWVSEVEGVVEGALGALSMPFTFHRGKMLQVAQFYVRPAAKGDGIKLFREMLRWADGRPAIRLVVASVELSLDKRIIRMLERLGFEGCQLEMIRRRRT